MHRTDLRDVKPFFISSLIFILIAGAIGFGIVRRGGSVDFQSFYAAGYQLRTHPSQMFVLARQEETQHAVTTGNSFIPLYHPGYEALLFAPFSFLNYQAAYLSYMVFKLLVLVFAFYAARPALAALGPVWQPRSGVILFLFLPLLVAFVQGQDTTLSLLLYCLAWRQLESGRDSEAGYLVAAAMFKFQFAIPIAALIAIWRGRRFATGFLWACVAMFLLSLSIVGPAGMADHFRLLSGAVPDAGNGLLTHKLALDQRTMQNISGLVYALQEWILPSSLLFHALTALVSLGIFVWCARVIRRLDQKTAFAIAILCGLLVSYHFLFYDLVLLLLPLALLAGRIPRPLLIGLFILPAVEIGLGFNWGFIMAVPLLATLVYVIATAAKSPQFEPEAVAAITM